MEDLCDTVVIVGPVKDYRTEGRRALPCRSTPPLFTQASTSFRWLAPFGTNMLQQTAPSLDQNDLIGASTRRHEFTSILVRATGVIGRRGTRKGVSLALALARKAATNTCGLGWRRLDDWLNRLSILATRPQQMLGGGREYAGC